MDVVNRIRISLAAVIGLAAAGSIALADTVVAGAPAEEFLPDLRTVAPGRFSLDLKHNSASGRTVLRLANKIANVGTGPLDLAAADPTGGCDPGEHDDPARPDRDANQRIYADTDGDAIYDPRTSESDPDVDQISDETKVGCFEYHPAHNHWHFQDFSQYSLDEVATGDLVAGTSASRKIGFCILDGDHKFPQLPGSPSGPIYPSNAPGPGDACGLGDPEGGPGAIGLSVGYADLYSYSTPGQSLELTGVPKGVYCLVSRANPPEGLSDIIESSTANNTRRRQIRISPKAERVEWVGEACPDPAP